MSRTSLDEILQYLKSFSGFEGIEIHQWPAWNPIATVDQLKGDFIERCKNTQYSERATTELSLYDRLQSLGKLDAVLTEPVIEDIRGSLETFEVAERQRMLQGEHKSPHNFPLQFHTGLLYAIFQHVKQLRKLLQDYGVTEQRISPYLQAAHELMIREARALHPMYPFGETKYKPESRTRSWDYMIRSIYGTVSQAANSAGVGRGRTELSIQLTKIVCSPSKFFHPGSTPTAEAIRDKIKKRYRERLRARRLV